MCRGIISLVVAVALDAFSPFHTTTTTSLSTSTLPVLAPGMASALRNPRNALILFALVAGALYLFSSSGSPSAQRFGYVDESLPARVRNGERIYQKTVGGRQGLIQKFGPTAQDVVM